MAVPCFLIFLISGFISLLLGILNCSVLFLRLIRVAVLGEIVTFFFTIFLLVFLTLATLIFLVALTFLTDLTFLVGFFELIGFFKRFP